MALIGDIKSFKLDSLFQLITMEGKSGVLRIDDEARQAKCYFQSGRLYHCSLAKLTGSSAFYELLTWEEGQFSFDDRGRIDLRTIYEPIDSLLIQASRFIEEWHVIKSQCHFEDEVFEILKELDKSADIMMKPDDWKIIRLIDGKLNSKQVAEKSGLGYLSTYRILFSLKSAGIIRSLKYRLLNLTLIPKRVSGKTQLMTHSTEDIKHLGVETAMQDLVYKMADGRANLEKITSQLQLDQMHISVVITQLVRQGSISLVDSKGNKVPIEQASIGEGR